MPDTTIIDVTADNIHDHPGAICFINPKHELYHKKVEWLTEQFGLGLKIKLLYLSGEKKPVGFIEYVPGEHCWRAVDADGWMFIHCLWTNGKKYQHQGLGGMLLDAVEVDTKGMRGIATITSDKAFMANRTLFLKHGYDLVAESGSEQLMAKPFGSTPLPSIHNVSGKADRYGDMTMLWSRQCPWVARFIEEVKPTLEEHGIKPAIIEITTPEEAQQAPSVYGVFNLLHNGKVYADRYISTSRFKNILTKEMKLT